MTKKVLLVIASSGFQPVEYGVTRSVLEEAGCEVLIASDRLGEADAVGRVIKMGVPHLPTLAKMQPPTLRVFIDFRLDEVKVENFDGIFIIGGSGALNHLNNLEMHRIVQKVAKQEDKFYGAICISPRILADAGVLKDRNVTCWNNDRQFQKMCDLVGASFVDEDVVVDENLITANGPDAAEEFGNAIVGALSE